MTHLGRRLSALIDGELGGAERDRVLVHLARCEPCRVEATALRTLKRRMSALGETAADASLTYRLIHMARLEATGAAAQPGGRARYAWCLAAGSVGVSIAGLATAAFMAGGPSQQQPVPRVTPAVYSYLNQHESDVGVEPATAPGFRKPTGMIVHPLQP